MLSLPTIESAPDNARLSALFEKSKQAMYRAAVEILHNREDAEDAVQQAFLAVLRHRELLKPEDFSRSLATLVLITERKAVDMRRREYRERQALREKGKLTGVEIPPPETSPRADALASLPVRYRTMLLLRYDVGYEVWELARLLECSPAAVRKVLQRAKRALERALRGEDAES